MISAGVSHLLWRVLFLLWGSHGKQLGLGWHSPKWRVIVILRANKRGANLKSWLYGLNRKCIWTWIWESLFFHRAIFKPWRLTLSRGYFFFSKLQSSEFFDWSQHLCFRSHGSEAKKEQCVPGAGTDRHQHCQHTSSIHTGSQSIIHTLQ